MRGGALATLVVQFALLSLLAFGGANGVVPEMQRQAVVVNHWMSDRDFASLFAIAQAAPGPNFMISTLVGWKVAGVPGAIVATLAMCVPSCLLTYGVARVLERHGEARWRKALTSGLAPVTVGLVGATAWVLARAADIDLRLGLITAAAAAIAYFTRLNPLWALAAAAGLGWLGVV